MNKQDFIEEIKNKTGLDKKDADGALKAVLETIKEELTSGGKVSFIGFGVFSTSIRAERVCNVPGTNKKVTVPQQRVANFKVGKILKEKVSCKSL